MLFQLSYESLKVGVFVAVEGAIALNNNPLLQSGPQAGEVGIEPTPRVFKTVTHSVRP